MSSAFRHRASLILNAVLAVTAVVLALPRSEPVPVAAIAAARLKAPASNQDPQLPQYPETAAPDDQRRWLVNQLRAMGVPNHTLARIVLESIDKEWNRRSVKVMWNDDALDAVQLEKDMSVDTQMRAALGAESFKQWDRENILRETLMAKVELTGSEADAIYGLKKKRQQQELAWRQALLKGEIDQSDLDAAYAKTHSEFDGQIKALLGAERYAKSQGSDDAAAAASLRQDLAVANPSDSQFKQVFNVQKQWDELRSALDKQFQDDPENSAYAEKTQALNEAREQEYRRVLGDSAFDALQKGQDGGYTKMEKYKTIWGLDDAKIDSVYGALQYYQKNIQDYQAGAHARQAQGQSVDWVEVSKNAQQFKEQTLQSLEKYLGQDSFNKLQQGGVFSQLNQN